MTRKLAIISSHPIQYNAPFFQELSQSDKLELKVFYTLGAAPGSVDQEFGKEIKWDIPLTAGYDYCYVNNVSKSPNSYKFFGIKTPDLIRDIMEWGADILLVYGWSFYGHLKALIYFRNKIPVLFRGDSHLLDEKVNFRSWLRKKILSWVYSHIDFALYVGEHNKQYYLKYGVKESQLLWVPHCTDLTRFEKIDTEKIDRWKTQLQLQNKVVFLYVGKFIKKKDPLLVARLAERLKSKEHYHFLFVGGGPLHDALQVYADRCQNISLMEFKNQSEMPEVYRLADVLILPSQGPEETWGLVVNEAMSCGLGVVITNKVGCGKDLVVSGQNGRIFKAGDLDALESIIQDEQLHSKEAKQNSLRIINDWSVKNAVAKFEEALEYMT